MYHKTIQEIKEHQEILIQNKNNNIFEDPFNKNVNYRKMRSPVQNRVAREMMSKDQYGTNYRVDISGQKMSKQMAQNSKSQHQFKIDRN